MKNLLILCLFLCSAAWGQTPQKFVIRGHIPGAKDGLSVHISPNTEFDAPPIATARIKDGKFLLEGTFEHPVLCLLWVDMNPEIKDVYQKDKRGCEVFLDNHPMEFSCESIEKLPDIYDFTTENIKLSGSPLNDLYHQYKASLASLRQQSRILNKRYLDEYHVPALDGVFHTRQGLDIAKQLAELQQDMQQVRREFLKAHPNSVVGIQVAIEMLAYGRNKSTKQDIQQIVASINPALSDNPTYQELHQMTDEMYPVAIGEKYMDIELTDTNGKKVQLADFIVPGRYNMLEFWASWCGPCRGEIPHLKHVRNIYGDSEFNMISISIDSRDKDWKKALKKENMPWTQLCDPLETKGPVFNRYQVRGVPYCLILDKEGKIIASGVRGSELDLVMVNILGDKFEK